MMMSSPAAVQISRRRVLQGTAWAAPAILVAHAVPAHAASAVLGCTVADNGSVLTQAVVSAFTVTGRTTSNWGQQRTTGWLDPTAQPEHRPNENPWSRTLGFVSMDDNASATQNAQITASYALFIQQGATYALAFNLQVGFANAVSSSRQSLVIEAVSDAGVTTLGKYTVRHVEYGGSQKQLPASNRTDAQMAALGYELLSVESWGEHFVPSVTLPWTALVSGPATVRLRCEIEPILDESTSGGTFVHKSDDIWVSLASVTQVSCG